MRNIKLPKNLLEKPVQIAHDIEKLRVNYDKQIDSMVIFEEGYAVPWALEVDAHGYSWLSGYHTVHRVRGGTWTMFISRAVDGFEVDVTGCDYIWSISNGFDVTRKKYSPVVKLINGSQSVYPEQVFLSKEEMKKYRVYHNRNWLNNDIVEITGASDMVIDRPVAILEAENLEDVYERTNTIDSSWWADKNNGFVGPRSTSAGDIIEDVEQGKFYIVESIGFRDVTDEIFLPGVGHCSVCGNQAAVRVRVETKDDQTQIHEICQTCYKPFTKALWITHVKPGKKPVYTIEKMTKNRPG